jgi:hypothetical protein
LARSAAWPLAARAQQTPKAYRVGLLLDDELLNQMTF